MRRGTAGPADGRQGQTAREGGTQSHGPRGSRKPSCRTAGRRGLDRLPIPGGSPHDAQAAQRRSGLHADRAPRRHPDHRHPRRDRAADVPRPAEEGPGRVRQVGRPQRRLADRVLLHAGADLRELRHDLGRHGRRQAPEHGELLRPRHRRLQDLGQLEVGQLLLDREEVRRHDRRGPAPPAARAPARRPAPGSRPPHIHPQCEAGPRARLAAFRAARTARRARPTIRRVGGREAYRRAPAMPMGSAWTAVQHRARAPTRASPSSRSSSWSCSSGSSRRSG